MRIAYSGCRRPRPDAPRAAHELYERIEEEAVHDVMQLPPGTVVVHGGEPTGIDVAVGRAAQELGLNEEVHAPDLAAHGGSFRAAALARNVYVTTVGPDGQARFFASPESRGTFHAHGLATKAGVPRILRHYQPGGGVRIFTWPEGPPPRLRVRSGNVRGYAGPGRLDVTRGSGRGLGQVFAPTSEILDPAIEGRRTRVLPLLQKADQILTGGTLFGGEAAAEVEALQAAAWAAEDELWATYLPLYTAEMRVSAGMLPTHPRWSAAEGAAFERGVRPNRAAWRAILDGAGAGARHAGWDWDGARLLVVCCYCDRLFVERGHCHARVLAKMLAAMGAEDGGVATGPGWGVVCTR